MGTNAMDLSGQATQGGTLYRLSSFAETAQGGNPAGVWVGNELPSVSVMQKIAKEVGYSETAFVVPVSGSSREVRYFSPEAEVPFCGHATIALGGVIGMKVSGAKTFQLITQAGQVPVSVTREEDNSLTIALTSVATKHKKISATALQEILNLLHWRDEDLDRFLPPAIAFAGAWHLILGVRELATLNSLDYEFEALKSLMLELDLTTLQLVYRESNEVIHSRNPFPVGGVVEDPATGAAAAALGGYLRDANLIETPIQFLIRQGEIMGNPSILHVRVPDNGGIEVSGKVVPKTS